MSRALPTRAPTLAAEQWLAARLSTHRALPDAAGIFAGASDPATRRERFRAAIVREGLAQVICGRDPGSRKPLTYAEAFERIYGERLEGSPSSPSGAAVPPPLTPGVHP